MFLHTYLRFRRGPVKYCSQFEGNDMANTTNPAGDTTKPDPQVWVLARVWGQFTAQVGQTRAVPLGLEEARPEAELDDGERRNWGTLPASGVSLG